MTKNTYTSLASTLSNVVITFPTIVSRTMVPHCIVKFRRHSPEPHMIRPDPNFVHVGPIIW